MKIFKTAALILLISMVGVFTLFAQPQMEDVVYLKNGNVYRGLIIEQVPSESLKIQTLGGNIFQVAIDDVEKITKENKVHEARSYDKPEPYPMHHRQPDDSTRRQYQPRKKGYFFNAQVLLENRQGGVRIVNGYKFNRFAYLGIGVGVDHVYSSPHVSGNHPHHSSSYSGIYLPLYLYFSGDILKKRVTPFYALEAGYAMGPDTGDNWENDNFDNDTRGGAMGGLGVGVKVNTKRRINFSLLLNINAKQVNINDTYIYYDDFGNAYTKSEKTEAVLFFPGIRLGLGF